MLYYYERSLSPVFYETVYYVIVTLSSHSPLAPYTLLSVGSSINSPKILKYYSSSTNVIGTTPLKIMFILGAVRGDDSERVLLVSEEKEGGGSRMVKLEFDSKWVREEMAMKLM